MARQDGFVSTALGRRRYLPDISSEIAGKFSQANRQAVNSIIQGSASEIIKCAMLLVEEELRHTWGLEIYRPRLLLQIHDELIYEVMNTSQAIDRFAHILKNCMEKCTMKAFGITIPLIANLKYGQTWGNMDPYNFYE